MLSLLNGTDQKHPLEETAFPDVELCGIQNLSQLSKGKLENAVSNAGIAVDFCVNFHWFCFCQPQRKILIYGSSELTGDRKIQVILTLNYSRRNYL